MSRGGVDVKGWGRGKQDQNLKELVQLSEKWHIYIPFYFSMFTKFQQQWITDRKGEKEPKCERTLVSFNLLKTGILLIISEDMN